MGRRVAAHLQARRLRGDLGAVVGVACRPAPRPAAGGGSVAELRQRTAGDDPLSRVSGQGLADRQRPDRGDLQDADSAAEGLGNALGCRQRREHHGAGGTGRRATNGTCTGKVSYGQRVKYARKFCQTPNTWPARAGAPYVRWSGAERIRSEPFRAEVKAKRCRESSGGSDV